VRIAAEHDAVAIVDATAGTLAQALAAAPDVVTPNLAEAEELLTGSDRHVVDATAATIPKRAAEAAGALVRRGARAAIATAGAAGLALAGHLGERWLEAPGLTATSPIGAGDALAAGLGSALERGQPLEEAVLVEMAAASASVEQQLPGRLDPARVDELRRWLRRARGNNPGSRPSAVARTDRREPGGAAFRNRVSGYRADNVVIALVWEERP
jgi:fructose-1-phosphate kinase PfkB-like protein